MLTTAVYSLRAAKACLFLPGLPSSLCNLTEYRKLQLLQVAIGLGASVSCALIRFLAGLPALDPH
jgi:hypothetical protein